MKKNYLTKIVKSVMNPLASTSKNWKKSTTFWLVALFVLSGVSNVFGQTTYTTGSGNFTVPCGVTSITVQIWGGGGAGGAADNNPNGGSGGGAGGYSTATLVVNPGDVIAYSVGTGGNGGSGNGGNGTATTFGTMTANGGNGGNQNQGFIGTGGTATGGTTNLTGGNGGLGIALFTPTGGAGGNAQGGGGTGGAARTGGSNNGNPGNIPGGGGGGALRVGGGGGRNGGDGARGEIRITYTAVTAPANPTSNSPQCNPPGVTLTRVGAPPAGYTWYWQTVSGGTSTANSGATFLATTSGTYYIRARHNLTSCWIPGEGSLAVVVNQAPGAIGGGATTVCNGSSTPAFTNPVAGGTWSVVNGTGSATITGGGVLTGTSTGTVTVNYTIGICPTATYSVTVNATPAAIGGGAATVCVGGTTPAFTNATAGGTWSTSNANATINASGVLTGVTAGTVRVRYTLPTGCFVQTALITINSLPTTVATPTPTNGATGVCYAGAGAVTSISWGAVAGATSYDVYFGAGSVPATVTANVATNTYNTGALTANTTYYWRIVAKNACGDAPTSATFSFTTSGSPCYCASSGTTFSNGISGVNFNTINNLNTAVNVAYSDYTYLSTSIVKTLSYNLRVFVNTGGNYTDHQSVYIDWNGNGSFADAGEFYSLGTATNVTNGLTSLSPLPITVPAGAITGSVRMRIQSRWSNATTGPCQTGFDGEVEDYILNIVAATPCTTPTAQPTALVLTPSGTSIAGSFTAASPAPNSYLVVVSTSATPPSAPIDGTTYAIGSTIAPGYYVIDNDSNTSFAVTGLNISTTYYIYIYSFNSLCTGGPLYNITSPLTGNITTSSTAPTYCNTTSDDTDALYINSVAFVGTLTDPPVNTSTFNATGFQDFTGLATKAIQAQGEGINIVARSNGIVLVRGTWKAWVDWNKNGTFEPASEEVYNIQGFVGADATFGFVIPPATLPGDYRIRIRVNNGRTSGVENYGFDFTPCDDFTISNANNGDYGETEDYLFTVVAKCNSLITTVTNGSRCDAGTVTLGATATAGVTDFRWYTTATGGSYTTSPVVGSSTTFTTPSISTTTNYYVTAWNGTCETQVRTLVIAKVSPIPVVSFTPASPVICGENSIISLTATGDTEITHLINENFEGAGLGVFSNINNDANGAVVDAITSWKNQTSTFVPTTTNVWFPAVSSGFGTNKFALAYSDSDPTPTNTIENSIALTTAVSSNTFLNLTLKLKLYYSRYFPDAYIDATADEYVRIELSTDGGTTYPILLEEFTSDVGIGTRFEEKSYDLSAYINQPNLKIRVRHRSYGGTGWLPDGVAIDDVELFGAKPLTTAFNYDTSTVDAFTNAGATIPYVSGSPATTIYIKPTLTQLENATFTIPVSATLSSGCAATGSVVVTNNTKIFKAGTTGTDWNLGTNWSPAGVPTANNCVVIFDNDVNITGTNYTALGRNLTIKPTGNLNVAPTNTALITDFVNVEAGGIFEVEDDASLVQVNNVANTVAGTFNSKRIAVTNNILDYVYWSTPVAGFSVNNITPTSTYRYAWSPTTVTGYASNFGNWTAASGAMTTGRGYIVRGSSGNTTFAGVPNNGDITIPISRSTYMAPSPSYTGPTSTQVTVDDDNWNLLGNPYPSALSADAFLTANLANLVPSVKIWTHGIDPAAIADPFYQDYQLNYNTSDYITYNRLGGTQAGFDGYIGSGQGFFVLMNDAGAITENAVFNNTMRSNAFRNDQFYRAGDTFERHRIWLKIISPTNTTNDMLVGYTSEATNGFDSIFDTQNVGVKTNFEIYSLIENSGYIIQGRGLPFNNSDQIPLGVVVPQNGIYRIAIDAVDGLFTNTTQNIYLEDTTLGITHDLRAAPYSFTANVGRYENRFVLKFNNETLGNEDFTANTVMVYANDNINVIATNQTIKSVRVHDLLGRVLGTFNNVNSNTFSSKNIAKTQSPLLVEVTLSNGTVVSKKAIY